MRVALYLHFPYLHFPPLQIRTCVFRTCVFSAPVCACWAYMYDVLRKRKVGSQAGLGLYGGRLVMAQNYSTH